METGGAVSPLDLLWLCFIVISLQPPGQQRIPATRSGALRSLETYTGSRAITLIHRRESYSSLGIPFGGLVDIDGSEAVIRAIETTGIEVPIDVVLHIPGGLTLGA